MNTSPRRRTSDSLWASLPRWAELAAIITVAVLVVNKASDIGASVQRVNDNVITYADRNCQVSAGINNALRITIATEIHDHADRRRVLALFPPVNCQR